MTILALPVDQRVIDIDSRRFASIEKAVVELITNCDDSYSRLGGGSASPDWHMKITYQRHQNGAILTVTDQAEGMTLERLRSVLSYGGAHSVLAQGGSGGRGYFGRGMKQAIYGLGHGWIESICLGRFSRVDLFRSESGSYVYDDWDGDRAAEEKDYARLGLPPGANGTKVTIVIDNSQVTIPYFRSLATAIGNNIYLRDILNRRTVLLINCSRSGKEAASLTLRYEEPEAEVLFGPEALERFTYEGEEYHFLLTLKKALGTDLILKGDERTNGLLVISGTAVLDCQFFRFENQLGTEYVFGTVVCPALADRLARGYPVISDEREGLNLKDPFVTAFAAAVSEVIAPAINQERQRLSHIDHATTSRRTQTMISQILAKMNRVAVEDLGILLPPGEGSGGYGPVDTGRKAAIRFTIPFYYRQMGRPFRVTALVDGAQFLTADILTVDYALPDSITVSPAEKELIISDLPADGRFQWTVTGANPGDKGTITVRGGPFAAVCEVVITDETVRPGYHHPSGQPPARWDYDNSTDLFAGYELRNLDNDIDRAVYDQDKRLIYVNTEAPTVRLYVDGQGHFRDGARLLLAELFLDVIAGELARRYVDRSTQKGDSEAYHQAKQTFVRRYGVDIHRILMGEG